MFILEITTFVIEMFQVIQDILCFTNKKTIPFLFHSHSTLNSYRFPIVRNNKVRDISSIQFPIVCSYCFSLPMK